MVLSTEDDPRHVAPDFDRRRIHHARSSPAGSQFLGGGMSNRVDHSYHRESALSPGRSPGGFSADDMGYDQFNKSPLRSSVFGGGPHRNSSPPGCVRRTTTQFVYPCRTVPDLESVTEGMRKMSTEAIRPRRQKSWTRSMDFRGLFHKNNDDKAHRDEESRKEALKSVPVSPDGNDENNLSSGMLDAYWHMQQEGTDAQQKQCGQRSSPWQSEAQSCLSPRMLERLDQTSRGTQGNKSTHNYGEDDSRVPRSRMNEFDASIAGIMKRCKFLEAESQYLREREIEVREDLCRARAENAAISAELKRTHDLYREALAARRHTRDALSEMAQQNARLVSAYVEKKQEFRNLQDSFDEEYRQWRCQIEALQTDLSAARQAQSTHSPAFSDSGTVSTGISGAHSSDEEESFSVSFSKVPQARDDQGKGSFTRPVTSSGDAAAHSLKELKTQNSELLDENRRLKRYCEEMEKERAQSDIHKKAQEVEELKKRGNSAFSERKWDMAVSLYNQAIAIGSSDPRMNAVLYCNRASCHVNTNRLLEAMSDFCMSILLDATYYKGYLRRADVLTMLGDYTSSLQDLRVVVLARCAESGEAKQKMKEVQLKLRNNHPLNVYKILCVPEDASQLDIRNAYKRLALKYHPDKAECKETAAVIFKLVAEANTILSDEEKKREHDLTVLRGRRNS